MFQYNKLVYCTTAWKVEYRSDFEQKRDLTLQGQLYDIYYEYLENSSCIRTGQDPIGPIALSNKKLYGCKGQL